MKKLYFLAVSVLALASCSHDLGDYERDAYPTLTKEQIKQNVQEVFGTTFDSNHDWNLTTTGKVTITANADLDNIVKVQILTESPFLNEDAKVLNETAVKKGDIVELSYDAPNTIDELIAACVDNNGNYYIQVFNVGQSSVSFPTAKAKTRAAINDELPSNTTLTLGFSKKSFNAERASAGEKCTINKIDYTVWHNSHWENDMLWELAENNTFDKGGWGKSVNRDICRAIDGFSSEEEKKNVTFMINSYLPKQGGENQINKRSNNLKKIRESANFSQNNNYLYTDGKNPVSIIPIMINTTDFRKNTLYYYYYNPKNIPAGMDEVEYIKSLPKFKAVNVKASIDDDDKKVGKIVREKEYLLPYYGDSPTLGSNEILYIFPAGYKIGFLNRKKGNEVENGCVYGDGRLNFEVNHIEGHYNSAIKDIGMTYTDPRIAIFTANKKTYMCFEDGSDCTFCDMVFEIVSGTEQIDENIEVGSCTYTYCFEDRQNGDYDMNDVVIKAKRIDETHIMYSLEACGAHDELYLRNINGKVLNGNVEIHQLFNVSTETFVNTEKGKRISPVQETIVVHPNFSLANPDQQVYIYNKTTNKNIFLSNTGDPDPHAIVIPYDYLYPLERDNISKAYQDFVNWAKTRESHHSWYVDPKGEVYTLSTFE